MKIQITLTLIFYLHTIVTVLMLSIVPETFSQSIESKKNERWQHLDLEHDTVYGISMDRAYAELLKGKTYNPVIVAVIDSGIDTLHEDLKPVLWRNSKEHGHDEDRNGYTNDIYGWNFLGSKAGNPPLVPVLEYERVYLSLKEACSKFSDNEIRQSVKRNCLLWLSVKERFKSDSASQVSANLSFWSAIEKEDSIWKVETGKEIYQIKDLNEITKRTGIDAKQRPYMRMFLNRDSTRTNQQQLLLIEETKIRQGKRLSKDPAEHRKETIGDDYNDFSDKYYGTPDVANDMTGIEHGTHVAGIIGAVRNNGIGFDGIANDVKLMILRVVPSGADEYDKDVALAIRYAVDNGAKVINMSFGKRYSPQQQWVENAIRYAAKNDVLIVHAAGNDAINTDSINYFPTSRYLKGGYAPNMITVGASGPSYLKLIAPFTNYGNQTVDVFAPGVNIYSTITGSKYEMLSGTSMAAPVVAGVAAMLRAYYPELTAVQIKKIIEQSVTKIDDYVTCPGTVQVQILMTELCKTGGIVNAYKAVQLADKLTKETKLRVE